MKIYERYEKDCTFRTLVDLMVSMIEKDQYTPTETREAAMLAQIIFEDRNPRPTLFSKDDVLGRVV